MEMSDIKIKTHNLQTRKTVLEHASKLGFKLVNGDSILNNINRLLLMDFNYLILREGVCRNIEFGYDVKLFNMSVCVKEVYFNDFIKISRYEY